DVPNGLRTSLRRLGAFQAIIVMPAPPHWHQFSAVQRDTHGQGLRNAFCSADEKRSCFRRALHAHRVAEERQPAVEMMYTNVWQSRMRLHGSSFVATGHQGD